MRKELAKTMSTLASGDERIAFITGDLGFNSFESLAREMGDRFINAGVAEQNMISVAAGMAHKGYKVFCYSIAPFIVYRCLEQFRNDVCFHKLPVFLIGNGGGYGYGIMGASHHALEDMACMSSMPNNHCYAPAFNEDIEPVLRTILQEASPAYLRLGLGKSAGTELSFGSACYSVLKSTSSRLTVVTLGPIVHNVLEALRSEEMLSDCAVFSALKFPFSLTPQLKESIQASGRILVLEEHVLTGGLTQQLAAALQLENIRVNSFTSLHAKGYPGGQYGDQGWHQKQSGLDVASLANYLKTLKHG